MDQEQRRSAAEAVIARGCFANDEPCLRGHVREDPVLLGEERRGDTGRLDESIRSRSPSLS
jgi:hypothetical protein